MSNFQARLKFYNGINTAYSANYTCLRIADQETPFEPEAGKVYTRADVFDKKPSDRWIAKKLDVVASARNTKIAALNDALSPNDESYRIIVEEHENAKNNFLLVYNAYYETDKKLEEIVDGFKILDKDFDEMIRTCLTSACVAFTDPLLEKVVEVYLYYLDVYEKYTLMKTYRDLIGEISNSLTGSGRKSYTYDKPANPLVKKLSREQILDYIKVTATVFCDQEDALKRSNKALTKAYKNGAKRSTDMYEAVNEVNRLTTETSNAGTLSSIAEELFDFATALELRLESANTDDGLTSFSKFMEKVNDFISGVDVFGKEQFKVNEIYVHQYELDYMKFLFHLLQTSPKKVREAHSAEELRRSTDKAKEQNKQKGE
ncbi:MAG: hypothetical protein IJA23_01955 [Clostridia bacterium]|nr:hypothetical protein [Clostridia bacterium]